MKETPHVHCRPRTDGLPGSPPPGEPTERKDRTHYLYLAVIAAVVLGIIVGLVFPSFATQLKWLGTLFVNLIEMMISPIIFCTIVLGIGSVRKAASVGRIGGLALGYFITMSTFALAIGLVVGNIIRPGDSLKLNEKIAASGQSQAAAAETSTTDFVLGIIPKTLVSALTEGNVFRRCSWPCSSASPCRRWARPAGRSSEASSTSSGSSSRSCRWSCGWPRSGRSAPSPRSSAPPAGTP